MDFGDLLLKLSTAAMAVSVLAAASWARGNRGAEKVFRWSYHAMAGTLVAASVYLVWAIQTHQFQYTYVFGYTSRDLAQLYLISAFWAGQQGTFLLWALLGALVGYVLLRRKAWEPSAVMLAYTPTIGFMHLLMLDPKGNPFTLGSRVPLDGAGLNVLLQDPWMATHPPAVFVGYVAATVPAALALVALFKRVEDRWLPVALRWSVISFVTLGIGIVLGGFWAYKVLGWGGYWGWDPVENASLIPWLVITALIHGILVQRATGALPKTNLALALASYVTVFYATFLTRSGVLADFSVHSFPAGSIYRILLGIQLLIVAVAAFALIRRWRLETREVEVGLAWPLVLTLVVVLFVISAGMVLMGTSWPIISSALGNAASFGPSWYNKVSLPIYVALLALLSFAPFLAWGRRPAAALSKRVVPVVLIALAGTVFAASMGARGVGALALFFVAVGGLTANLIRLAEVARTRVLNTGAAVAHLGFAMMFVGIVGSSAWGTLQKADLPQDTPVEVLGRTMTFLGHVDGSEPQDRWAIRVEEPGREPYRTEVGMFRTGTGRDESVMHKPAIVRSVARDLYLSPAGLTSGGEHREVELALGRPVPLGGVTLTFLGFGRGKTENTQGFEVLAEVRLARGDDAETLSLPMIMSEQGTSAPAVAPTIDAGIASLQMTRMAVEQKKILVHLDLPALAAGPVLSIEASTKPLIGLLWAGTILLGLGCTVAVVRRLVDERAIARARVEAEAAAPPRERTGKKRRKARSGAAAHTAAS